jgi:hypothetical protein
MDLTRGSAVQFTVLVGSVDSGCSPLSHNTKNVFVQYSKNGGITWNLLETIQYNMSPPLKTYVLPLPMAMKTAPVRVRWYQPIARGSTADVWAIDHVVIS